MTFKSPLFFVGVFLFVAEEQTIICCAFRWKAQNTERRDTNSRSQDNLSHKRPNRLLQTLTSLAQNGATVWTRQYESGAKLRRQTRLKQTSTLYEPHNRIQRSNGDHELNIDRVSNFFEEDSYQVKSPWPDHFFEEALALIAGGAAANRYSLFTTVVAGTIFATVIVTVGVITSALFFDESEEDFDNYLRKDDFKSVQTTNVESKGCDLEEGVFGETDLSEVSSDQSTFTDSTLRELQKCFAGKPSSEFVFIEPPNKTCSRDLPQYESSGFGVDHDFLHGDNLVDTQVNNHHLDSERDELKREKIVKLIWHDSHSATVNQYYTGKTYHQRQRSNTQKASDQSFDLEDTEREGAMLLSNSFRVASLAFGLLGDAVRFAGESTAASAGASARLVGGAIKAGGWAVGSLGSTLSADKSSDGNSDHSERRHGKRHVAGASVKLLGDAIDNVAESFLLAGSATERIAFAATGVAEGVVRVVEDFTSTLSKVFAKEGEASVSDKPSQIVVDKSAPKKAVNMISLDDSSHQNELIDNVDDQSQDVYHDNTHDNTRKNSADVTSDHLLFLSLATIMQGTAGVPSTSTRVLFILVILYFSSLMLLKDPNSSNDNDRITVHSNQINRRERKNKNAIPHGITADEADTHSTLTVDSTMKRGPDFSFASRGARCVLWTTVLPFRLFYAVLVHAYCLIISKKTALLVLHILAWFLICQMSQNRAAVIERRSMLTGYKNAVESIGSSFVNDHVESAFWLNSIISRVWRVRARGESDIGGIEPLLASSVSSLLARRLEETYSRPSGVAHVSLESLTFGASPPFVRDIMIKGADVKEAKVYLTIDVIMLLEDAALMLDIKPSSLEYRMVPSTKISINSHDLQLSLDLSLKPHQNIPTYLLSTSPCQGFQILIYASFLSKRVV